MRRTFGLLVIGVGLLLGCGAAYVGVSNVTQELHIAKQQAAEATQQAAEAEQAKTDAINQTIQVLQGKAEGLYQSGYDQAVQDLQDRIDLGVHCS